MGIFHQILLGYYPDGYCHETNTIYELYKRYDKQKNSDNRQSEIVENSGVIL